MTFGQAKKITGNIHQYIKAKRCKTYLSGEAQNFTIKEGALNLGFSISGNPLDRRNGDKAIVKINENIGSLERLSLSYYSMPMGVALCYESIVAYAMYYHCNYQRNGATTLPSAQISEVVKTAQLIQDVFKNEFLTIDGPGLMDENKVKEILQVAHERKLANIDF